MSTIEVACNQCAGQGWTACKTCPGDGKMPCPEKCVHGMIRCRAECNYGWSTTQRCQYCKGGEPTCKACNPEGFMRCESCNPFTHGNTVLDRPGWIRCPANCDAGTFVCPECKIYKWGGGKVSCQTCSERGVIAMEVPDDPPVA